MLTLVGVISARLGVWIRRGNHFRLALCNQVEILGLPGLLKDPLVLPEVEFLEAGEHPLDAGLSVGPKCRHALEEQLLDFLVVTAERLDYLHELGVGHMQQH